MIKKVLSFWSTRSTTKRIIIYRNLLDYVQYIHSHSTFSTVRITIKHSNKDICINGVYYE